MTSTQPPITFETLPEDVLFLIFEYLASNLEATFRMGQVSKFMKALVSSDYVASLVAREFSKEFPMLDLISGDSMPTAESLIRHLKKYKLFHDAWRGPSASISPRIQNRRHNRLEIEEMIWMIRIIPGGRYIVVVDYKERALFFEIASGKKVGMQTFSRIYSPAEVVYSIDFCAVSANTVAWGVLTSGNPADSKICARVILIHLPEAPGKELDFELVLEHPLEGTAEMISINRDSVAIYTYHVSGPTLCIWNWTQQTHSRIDNDLDYVAHPSLFATPSTVFMIGGLLGIRQYHARLDESSHWSYQDPLVLPSTSEDIHLLRNSSQGRCSKSWSGWGDTGRHWHRLVTSPSSGASEDDKRPLRVLSFEVPRGFEDMDARRSYIELGHHNIAPGVDTSPHLYHISRFGTKVIWFAIVDGNITIQSVSLPNLEAEINGQKPSSVKRIVLPSCVNVASLRAFDLDETVPLLAFAEERSVWLMEISCETDEQ